MRRVTTVWLSLLWDLARRLPPRIDQITRSSHPGSCACAGAGSKFFCDQKWPGSSNSWTPPANLRACLPQQLHWVILYDIYSSACVSTLALRSSYSSCIHAPQCMEVYVTAASGALLGAAHATPVKHGQDWEVLLHSKLGSCAALQTASMTWSGMMQVFQGVRAQHHSTTQPAPPAKPSTTAPQHPRARQYATTSSGNSGVAASQPAVPAAVQHPQPGLPMVWPAAHPADVTLLMSERPYSSVLAVDAGMRSVLLVELQLHCHGPCHVWLAAAQYTCRMDIGWACCALGIALRQFMQAALQAVELTIPAPPPGAAVPQRWLQKAAKVALPAALTHVLSIYPAGVTRAPTSSTPPRMLPELQPGGATATPIAKQHGRLLRAASSSNAQHAQPVQVRLDMSDSLMAELMCAQTQQERQQLALALGGRLMKACALQETALSPVPGEVRQSSTSSAITAATTVPRTEPAPASRPSTPQQPTQPSTPQPPHSRQLAFASPRTGMADRSSAAPRSAGDTETRAVSMLPTRPRPPEQQRPGGMWQRGRRFMQRVGRALSRSRSRPTPEPTAISPGTARALFPD